MIQRLQSIYSPKVTKITVPLVFLIFAFTFDGYAQRWVMGSRILALGQSGVAIPDQQWAVFNNPAMLSSEDPSVSFYGVRYYGFSELTDMTAAINYPTKWGVVAAGAHQYGFDLFRESRFRLGYKYEWKDFHAGLVMNYTHVAIGGDYGSAGALGVDLGIAAMLLPKLWMGMRATNINNPKLGAAEEELDREFAIGLSYKLSDIALFTSDLVKDVRYPLSYRGGVEITMIDNLVGRVGVSTKPTTFSAGFGYHTDRWGINIAAQRDEILGLSPGLDFNVSW